MIFFIYFYLFFYLIFLDDMILYIKIAKEHTH